MNASQRRQIRRATVSALAAVGIVPGALVSRKPAGKSTPTAARVEVVTFSGGSIRPELQVKRADRQTAYWPAREIVQAVRLRSIGKGHALRMSA